MPSVEEYFNQIPVVTRTYLCLAFLTTGACTFELVSPLSLYFNWKLITQGQIWRLFTNFCFFGQISIDFVFHMFFLVRYCRMLEEGSFHRRTADFFYMLLFGAVFMTALAPFILTHFLGPSLTFMMVYVWGRRNEHVRMSFLGIFHFTAPYLPWVLLAFSLLLGNALHVDLIGIAAGHVYYFLEDVWPRTSGRRLLKTPEFIKFLFQGADEPVFDGTGLAVSAEEAAQGEGPEGVQEGSNDEGFEANTVAATATPTEDDSAHPHQE